jgi:UDP-3-O-[3-hydroxymyristoyl] glucosamine N-acyltransferase
MRLHELAREIGAEVDGDGDAEVTSVATLEDARAGQISFLANPKYLKQVEATQASAVILAPTVRVERRPVLRMKDPYYGFCRAAVLLHGHRKHPFNGVHPKAIVDPSAKVGQGTVIYPGCFIGPNVTIGRDCVLYPNVTIYNDCTLEDRVILHAGTVIGVDGFGYATNAGVHHKIPQLGTVHIESDVEIGANCTIARGTLETTRMGKGSKIDGLVMIGHGCQIGPGCVIVAQVGIAGSTELGKYVTAAGQVGIAGHLKIGDQVTIAARTGVIFDVEANQTIAGTPAMPAQQARRVYSIFTKLPELQDRVKAIEEQVAELGESGEAPSE